MKPYKKKLAIGIVALMVLGAMIGFVGPGTVNIQSASEKEVVTDTSQNNGNDEAESHLLDQYVRLDPDDPETRPLSMAQEVNDAGYNTDVGNTILKALPLYPGEPEDGFPGRGRTGRQ